MKCVIQKLILNECIQVIFLLLTLTFSIHAREETSDSILETDLLQRSQTYSQDLLNRFDPKKYFVIGFGNTTALTGAYLRDKLGPNYKNYYKELMVSGINDYMISEGNKKEINFKETFFKMMDMIIPPDEILKGRKIIIHRVLWMGATHLSFTALLKEYKKRRPELKFGAYFIGYEDVLDNEFLFHDNVFNPKDIVVKKDDSFTRKLLDSTHTKTNEAIKSELNSYRETEIANFKELREGHWEKLGVSRGNPRNFPRISRFDANECTSLLSNIAEADIGLSN
jgi:hypothetical protein